MSTVISSVINPQVRNCGGSWEQAWDAYVYQHPKGSPFHLTGWKRAIEKAFGLKPNYLMVDDQGAIRGVLPLFEVRNPVMGKVLLSTPFAVYGGVCASDEESAQLLRDAACAMARENNVQYLELRERSANGIPDLLVKHLYVTFDRELPATTGDLLRQLPRDTRYMIRKAQKHGLSAVVDNAQLDRFYDIYAHSVRNLGTPVFGRRFFRILLDEFREQCEITVVWQGHKALAAVLSFRFRDWILPYYGGSLLEGRPLAANNFMYWEVMKRALEGTARHFDFGRSKIGTGAYSFKTQWNMREHPLPYQFYLVRRRNMPNFSPANPRFKLATEAWRRLPLGLTKVLGPALVHMFP